MLHGQEHRVVSAADVDRAAALLTRVAAEMGSALLVDLLPLRLGEEFLARIFGRALQGCIELVGPDSLEIRLAPCCFQDRAGSRRSLSREPARRQRDGGADGGGRNGESEQRA